MFNTSDEVRDVIMDEAPYFAALAKSAIPADGDLCRTLSRTLIAWHRANAVLNHIEEKISREPVEHVEAAFDRHRRDAIEVVPLHPQRYYELLVESREARNAVEHTFARLIATADLVHKRVSALAQAITSERVPPAATNLRFTAG